LVDTFVYNFSHDFSHHEKWLIIVNSKFMKLIQIQTILLVNEFAITIRQEILFNNVYSAMVKILGQTYCSTIYLKVF